MLRRGIIITAETSACFPFYLEGAVFLLDATGLAECSFGSDYSEDDLSYGSKGCKGAAASWR